MRFSLIFVVLSRERNCPLVTKCWRKHLGGHGTENSLFLEGMSAAAWIGALKKKGSISERTSMSKAKRRPPESEPVPATPDQIREAYLALSEDELAKTLSYARWRFGIIGRRRREGREPGDLIKDALIAMLAGDRVWYPEKVPFFVSLTGVIRSQTSNLRKKAPTDTFDVERLDVSRGEDDEKSEDFFDTFEAPPRGDASALEGLISARFASDAEAALVLEALLDEKKPPEIRESLGLSQKEYETTVRRIRRTVERLLEESQA
jgi:DNA-directed RNA polymerase specialized sigma24 family protein